MGKKSLTIIESLASMLILILLAICLIPIRVYPEAVVQRAYTGGVAKVLQDGDVNTSTLLEKDGSNADDNIDIGGYNFTAAGLATNQTLNRVRINTQANNEPCIAFVFDDGDDSAYSIVYPALTGKGVNATFAIITNLTGTAGYITWSQAEEMYAAGMEIASHGMDGDSFGGAEARTISEMSGSKTEIEAHNMTVSTVVYPIGAYTNFIRATAGEYYDWGVAVNGAYNTRPIDGYLINRMDGDAANTSTIEGYVDDIETSKGLLVLMYHVVDASVATEISDVIDYIQGKNIAIKTIDQAMSQYGNAIEAYSSSTGFMSGIGPDGSSQWTSAKEITVKDPTLSTYLTISLDTNHSPSMKIQSYNGANLYINPEGGVTIIYGPYLAGNGGYGGISFQSDFTPAATGTYSLGSDNYRMKDVKADGTYYTGSSTANGTWAFNVTDGNLTFWKMIDGNWSNIYNLTEGM